MLPGERHGLGIEEGAQDLGVLDHAVDSDFGRIHRDARSLIVESLPARTEPDLEPATGQLIDRRELPREDGGVAEVAIEHQRTDVQRRRDRRRGRHGCDRAEVQWDRRRGHALEHPALEGR